MSTCRLCGALEVLQHSLKWEDAHFGVASKGSALRTLTSTPTHLHRPKTRKQEQSKLQDARMTRRLKGSLFKNSYFIHIYIYNITENEPHLCLVVLIQIGSLINYRVYLKPFQLNFNIHALQLKPLLPTHSPPQSYSFGFKKSSHPRYPTNSLSVLL